MITMKRGNVERRVTTEFEVNKLQKLGYKVMNNTAVSEDTAVKSISDMTVKELKQYAADNNIDISSFSKRGDILDVISKASS